MDEGSSPNRSSHLVAADALLCGSTWKPVPHQIVRCGISCAPALFNSPCKKPGRVREGMAFCMSLGSCLLSGRQTMVDHFRLRWVQACGEGESGAYNETFSTEKRLTPPPRLERGKTHNYNRHNTLSPFSDDPLCSAINQIKRESNVCPFQRRSWNVPDIALGLACMCICTRLLLYLTHSPSTMH